MSTCEGIEWRPPEGVTVEEGRALLTATLAMAPAAWGVRELISYDLPLLWPIVQARAAARFERADRAARLRFLARGGVRYCLLSSPPHPGAAPLQRVGEQFGPMAVYECVADARRADVVATGVGGPGRHDAVGSALRRVVRRRVDRDAGAAGARRGRFAGSPRLRRPPASRRMRDTKSWSTPPPAPGAGILCCGTRSIPSGASRWTGGPRRCFEPTRSTAPFAFRLVHTRSRSGTGPIVLYVCLTQSGQHHRARASGSGRDDRLASCAALLRRTCDRQSTRDPSHGPCLFPCVRTSGPRISSSSPG